jgi:hypothetical protein
MNLRQILAALVLVDFTALTAWTLYHDNWAILGHVAANWTTLLMAADLVIALGVAMGWMVRDARQRGVSPWPYVVLTCTLGSVGPLAYLALRPDRHGETAPAPQAWTAAA